MIVARPPTNPFAGGGEDHAYRTNTEAVAAARAERAVDQDPSRPIPADVNQSPERQRQEQQQLVSEKETNHRTATQKQSQKPWQRQ